MNRCTFFSDSLALPRPEEGVPLEKTYMYELHKNGWLIIDRCKRSADTTSYLNVPHMEFCDLYMNNSLYYVVQLGFCDSSPRIFTKRQKLFIQFMQTFKYGKILADRIFNIVTKNRFYITKKRSIVNVEISEFEENIKKIVNNIIYQNNQIKKIILINILHPTSIFVERSYNVINLIKNYNNIINNLSDEYDEKISIINFFDFTKDNPGILLKDGYHYNIKGHEFLYKSILKIIKKDSI
ncbi:hypothetical protein P618_200693 [Holospora obtusa F1]|uniref:SGNH hydrolase-type esterase domain-containing protein n=1 Tax=Holospora obtusa F1 TaxID=1399147 RepID=W6TGU7_HOLOB|nr:SGNH/GDSL hydrolase family protein [Holospora obtusa]ETZ07150.1 hypothetical protein P618_200693 [Holospora obtusa F1]